MKWSAPCYKVVKTSLIKLSAQRSQNLFPPYSLYTVRNKIAFQFKRLFSFKRLEQWKHNVTPKLLSPHNIVFEYRDLTRKHQNYIFLEMTDLDV